jgi:hypothetical protein
VKGNNGKKKEKKASSTKNIPFQLINKVKKKGYLEKN